MENAEKFYLKDVYYTERGDKNMFKVSWKMTDLCPYHCSYCYMADAVEAARAKKNNPTQEQVEEIASKIDKYVEQHCKNDRTAIWLHLIGGEVSMFNLIAVLDKIKRVNSISIATNLFRKEEYWVELQKYCRSRGIACGVSASFHLEMLNEEQRWEFCHKLKTCKFQMKAVVDNSNCDEYKPYFDYVMENELPLEITLTRDNENRGAKLTKENQEYVDRLRKYQYDLRKKKNRKPYYIAHLKNGERFEYTSNIALLNNTYDGVLDYTGFYCNAGKNNIRITQKGDLLRSACRICSSIMKVGNILDESTWVSRDDMKPFLCDCNFREKGGERTLKGCTCFNNTEMWLPGYDNKTKTYTEKEVKMPNYWEMYAGTDRQLVNCKWDKANVSEEETEAKFKLVAKENAARELKDKLKEDAKLLKEEITELKKEADKYAVDTPEREAIKAKYKALEAEYEKIKASAKAAEAEYEKIKKGN